VSTSSRFDNNFNLTESNFKKESEHNILSIKNDSIHLSSSRNELARIRL